MKATRGDKSLAGPVQDLSVPFDLAARGVPVFPCWTVEGGVCQCASGRNCSDPGKHPRLASAARGATTESNEILRLSRRLGAVNWAAALANSGFSVLDVDPRAGGDESIGDFEKAYGKLPDSWRTLTGGGGFHVWLTGPKSPDRVIAPGVDWKSKGYVILPGSTHASGLTYEWEVGYEPASLRVAEIPAWIQGMVSLAKGTDLEEPPELAAFSPRRCPPLDGDRLSRLLEPGTRFFAIWHRQGLYAKYRDRGSSELDMALMWELQREAYTLWDAQPVILEFRRLWKENESKAWRRDYLVRTWLAVQQALKTTSPRREHPILHHRRISAIAAIVAGMRRLVELGLPDSHIVALQRLCLFMQDDGTCFMSVRKLAQLAGKEFSWGGKCLRNLETAGLIERIGTHKRSKAQIWKMSFLEDQDFQA